MIGSPNGQEAQKPLTYVLITPARNEELFIEQTIRSVISQTVLPKRWVIVSDGSTDATDSIIDRYCKRHDWITLLRMPERVDRHFAAKARSFNTGYNAVRGLDFEIIGNLDADITFGPEYIQFLLDCFVKCPRLGVAGTPYVESKQQPDRHTYSHSFAQLEHVSGACQLFRRECFDEIGGFVPLKGGAVDWIAVTTARMNGWSTRTFLEKTCFHHRRLGTGTDNCLMVRFRYGQKAYAVGGHPVWELSRAIFQMKEYPPLIGSLFFLAGYLSSFVTSGERPVSQKLLDFHRGEQMARLRQAVLRVTRYRAA